MNDRDYFSHDASDGSGPGDRLDAAGIDCTGWAENIAYEYHSSFSLQDADSIVQGWIDSPGHERNLVGDYNEQVSASISATTVGSWLPNRSVPADSSPYREHERYAPRDRPDVAYVPAAPSL